MIDLFGLEQQPKRHYDKPEAAALLEVLKALNTHNAVAWCERMNSGAAHMGARFVRFGFKGCPDVLGQLRDGRLLGVEVKTKTRKQRPKQKLCCWSAFVALLAWHSLPTTCATGCANLARHDVPELHLPPARDDVGLLADDMLSHETGHALQMRALQRPAAGLIQ